MFQTRKERVEALKAGIDIKNIEAVYNITHYIIVKTLPITKCEIRQW